MKIWIIPSPIDGTKECLLIPKDTILTVLPQAVQAKFNNAEVWKTIDLKPNDNRIALDAVAVCAAIEAHGYFITGSQIILDEKE